MEKYFFEAFAKLVVIVASIIIISCLCVIRRKVKKKDNTDLNMLKLTTIIMIVILMLTTIRIGMYVEKENTEVIDTSINIKNEEYLPFREDTKIYKLDHEASLKLEDNLPILDGAAAVFPVYSAFVNAVYPSTVKFGENPFVYNNTVEGYKALAEKKTDIFFGAYPSEEQIAYAKSLGTEFEYTEIGKEAFVFFVNKKNPVNNLSSAKIRAIYSGKITNWKDVGGKDKEIIAYQRNEGSGSQSMLKRFMGSTPIMQAPKEAYNDFMGGIIKDVAADYKNYSYSIGFSFRYYLNTLIANPRVKMLSVDGVEPTPQNISNGSYPIVTSLYAVTYKDNPNENVQKLLDWILSEEGQEIIEETGYSPVK